MFSSQLFVFLLKITLAFLFFFFLNLQSSNSLSPATLITFVLTVMILHLNFHKDVCKAKSAEPLIYTPPPCTNKCRYCHMSTCKTGRTRWRRGNQIRASAPARAALAPADRTTTCIYTSGSRCLYPPGRELTSANREDEQTCNKTGSRAGDSGSAVETERDRQR